jgi:hypothetical protein
MWVLDIITATGPWAISGNFNKEDIEAATLVLMPSGPYPPENSRMR